MPQEHQKPAEKPKSSTPQFSSIANNENPAKSKSNLIETPSISLPKGGGAIKSIDEKFQVNAANGTASFSIPFPVSQARGFVPSLGLSYNSGGGNSPFGLGWNLEAPSIQRKTDKKIPEYRDKDESDTFMYSGAEDLVPYLDENGIRVVSPDGKSKRYRPRVEGGFEKIEKVDDAGNVYWKVTTKDNIVSIFGRSKTARIADPADDTRIFQWFLEFRYDDKGHCILYTYQPEDRRNVPDSLFECNRANGFSPVANTYLKRIFYGNKTPWYVEDNQPEPSLQDYLLSVVFDYGEWDKTETPTPDNDALQRWVQISEGPGDWAVRKDAFSDFHAGFEIRTYRLCQRILQFHHFEELAPDPCLVRSMEFTYDRLPHEPRVAESPFVNDRPFLTYLRAITQCGYIWHDADARYAQKSLPPLTFDYMEAPVFGHGYFPEPRSIAREQLTNLPVGIDDKAYTWTDLYSEGVSGILTEQGEGWFYKENLGRGEFSSAKLVFSRPSFSGLASGAVQLQDLQGDGMKQLVTKGGAANGFFELSPEEDWQPFIPFERFPNVDLADPNAKFIDLDGDGVADLLITEQNAFVWYPGRGRQGYDASQCIPKRWDEERGPNIVFADSAQSVVLADMSGDGLTDIVRIRNGELCYWPNMGYGRFGAKVTMENAPHFDTPERFSPRQIRLADIDGSGTTDILYLGHNEFKIWYNHSGNMWSNPTLLLNAFPAIDSESHVSVIDFLGQGTSCIVWSSSLPQFTGSPLRYIDLCGGKKPHIMHRYCNNLGKEITWEYRSSTEYYLSDKKNGRQWATKLAFPVQCVHKVVVQDHISQTRFVNEYRYRHGYYDHSEREFRGFAFVEQTDTEAFTDYKIAAAPGGVMATEPELFQPKVITRSWFHTGAFLEKARVLHQLEQEYWPNTTELEDIDAVYQLPEIEFLKEWTTAEWREASRALKGLILRQEVYSDEGTEAQKVHPYTITQHNYDLRRIQPQLQQKHAVFFPHEKETLVAHYEREPKNPRVVHSANIEMDAFGNVLQSASVVYGRKIPDLALPLVDDREKQTQIHITYTKNRFTDKIDDGQTHRLPVGCETQTWELKATPDDAYFTAVALRDAFEAATPVDYSQQAHDGEKRKVEHTRTLFLNDDLSGLLPLGTIGTRALAGEAYALAYTPAMIPALFGAKASEAMLRQEGRFTNSEGDDNFWIASGRSFPYPDLPANPHLNTVLPVTAADVAYARQHFYMPVVFQDAFGHLTKIFHDKYHLFIERTLDAAGNETAVEGFNYRTLKPYLLRDANDNRSGVRFDELGLVISTFILGKAGEQLGDLLDSTVSEASPNDDPTSKMSYEFQYYQHFLAGAPGKTMPNRVKTEVREKHRFKTPEDAGGNTGILENNIRWQTAYSYSDGSGHEVLKKVEAEKGDMPERDANGKLNGNVDTTNTKPRWVGNGRVILNNKGNPVKQYEPFFDSTEAYNDEAELVHLGVTPLLFYDALGRLIKTVNPNGSFSKIAFNAWKQETWDENDTVKESDWYTNRIGGQKGAAEFNAAERAAIHDRTPAIAYLDSLGRVFHSIAQNATQRSNDAVPLPETYRSRSEYDIEGNALGVTDARNNTVMRWQYDMLGNVCRQTSMDAGERWMLYDAMGKPLHSWDSRNHVLTFAYDNLRRPTSIHVAGDDGDNVLQHTFERFEYGETAPNAKQNNLCGKLWRHFDAAGLVENAVHDFKGNLLKSTRRLLQNYINTPHWDANPAPVLENEIFSTETRFDALNRPVKMTMPDNSLVTPEYNEANLLNTLKVNVRGANTVTTFVQNIDYNAKGQRERIQYGNNSTTRYDYERETFRLANLLTTADNGTRILQDLHYTYDPVGNITEIYDNAQKTVFYGGQRVDSKQQYTYDALYRLVEATGREHIGQVQMSARDNWDDNWAKRPSVQPNSLNTLRDFRQEYVYDAVGNILTMQHFAVNGGWTRTNTYALNNNRLSQSKVGNPVFSHEYLYNEHGSMRKMPHLPKITWNFKEEMSSVHFDLAGGRKAWYVYDSSGQRMRKIVQNAAGSTDEYIYLGGCEIFRRRTGSTITLQRETLHIMDDKQRVAMVETRTKGNDGSPKQLQRYQYANHLGTACLELDEGTNGQNARVISYEEYHPYGTTAYQAMSKEIQAAAKRYRYTGMERDEETGLNYHAARYYAVWLGRWTAADPIGVGDGVNVYAYVSGNPVKAHDPKGLGDEDPSAPPETRPASTTGAAASAPQATAPATTQTGRQDSHWFTAGGVIPPRFQLDYFENPRDRLPPASLTGQHFRLTLDIPSVTLRHEDPNGYAQLQYSAGESVTGTVGTPILAMSVGVNPQSGAPQIGFQQGTGSGSWRWQAGVNFATPGQAPQFNASLGQEGNATPWRFTVSGNPQTSTFGASLLIGRGPLAPMVLPFDTGAPATPLERTVAGGDVRTAFGAAANSAATMLQETPHLLSDPTNAIPPFVQQHGQDFTNIGTAVRTASGIASAPSTTQQLDLRLQLGVTVSPVQVAPDRSVMGVTGYIRLQITLPTVVSPTRHDDRGRR